MITLDATCAYFHLISTLNECVSPFTEECFNDNGDNYPHITGTTTPIGTSAYYVGPSSDSCPNHGLNTTAVDNKDIRTKAKSFKSVYFDQFLELNCSFLCPTELSDDIVGKELADFGVFHNNIRSINKNLHKIDEVFQNCPRLPPVLAFSETNINENSTIPALPGYSFEHVDSSSSAGGVGLFVSDKLKYSLRNDISLQVKNCEDVWIEISIDSQSEKAKSHNIIIGVIYRHPGHKYDIFSDKLCNLLDVFNKSGQNYYICGDLNINLLKYNVAANVTDYMNSIASVGCNILIDKPTRITSNTATCLDHVYTNLDACNISNYVIMGDVSDHFGTYSKIGGLLSNDQSPQDVFFRKTNLSESQWNDFNNELHEALQHLPTNPETSDVNEMARTITTTYTYLINKYMPLRKLSKNKSNKPDKPWITSGIKKSIRKKAKLYTYQS